MATLDDLRARIDEVDAQLIATLAQRFRLTDEVGRLKRDHQLPAVDLARETQQTERIQRLAQEHRLDPDVATAVLRCVIDAVVASHRRLA